MECTYGLPIPFAIFSDYIDSSFIFLFAIGLILNTIFWFIVMSFFQKWLFRKL